MIFGKDLTSEIQSALRGEGVFAVTDANVARLYPELFTPGRTFVLEPGEARKNLDSVSEICAFLNASGADRQSKLIAVGGGVVGDTAGFAASIYMRGIAWALVPTTLLALCDSSVGGKTGVNFKNLKNILGTFHFPEQVYLSAHFIKTLPEREFLCGIGEALKTACLSKEIFDFVLQNEKAVFLRDGRALERLIRLCAEFKNDIVTRDPREKTGLRKILNYGHTVGHAIETADNQRLSHGEYILHGMRIENRMAGDIVNPAFFAESERLFTAALSGKKLKFDVAAAAEAAASDKKNADGKISFIAVIEPGAHKEIFFTKKMFERKLKEISDGF